MATESSRSVVGSAPPATRASRPASTNLNVVVAILAIAGASGALVQTMTSPALPEIAASLGVTVPNASWVLTALLLSAAISTPVVGRLGDIHGTRPVIVMVLAIGATGTAISALAPTLPIMIVGQVLQGVMTGLFPLAFSTIRHTLPAERSAGSIGLLSGVLGIGTGLGLVLAGVIVDTIGYRFIFWLPLVIIVLSLLAVLRWVPTVPGASTHAMNWPSAALLGAGLGLTLFGITRTSSWGLTAPATLGTLAAGAVLIGLWFTRDRRSDHPLVNMRTMRLPVVWRTDLTGLTLAASMYIALILIPQYAQTSSDRGYGFGTSVTGAGLLIVPLAVAMLIVGPLAGVIQRRIGGRPAIITGGVFITAGYLVLIVAHDTIGWVLVATAALGIGLGLGYSAMSNLIANAVPPGETGEATGVNTMSRQVGAAVGSAIAATIVASSALADGLPAESGYVTAFAVAAGLGVLAVAAATAIPRSVSPAPGRAPP